LLVRQILTVIEEAREGPPPLEHVFHHLRDCGVSGEPGPLGAHPGLKLNHQGSSPLLAPGVPLGGRQSADLALDGEDRVDPADGFDRQRSLGHVGQDEELASPVTPARRLGHRPWPARRIVEFAEFGIRIGLQDPSISGEMPSGMLAAAVTRVEEHRLAGRRRQRSVVPDIGPEPADDRLPLYQNRHGGVVAVEAVGGEDVTADQGDQRLQRRCACAYPVRQGRDVELDALTGVHGALTAQRLVLAELGIEDHRQQARARPVAGGRSDGMAPAAG
jgi:hypothetical protein